MVVHAENLVPRNLRNYRLLDEVSEDLLVKVKLLHLCGSSSNSKNSTLILITENDDVYAIGSNRLGALGIGVKETEREFSNVPVKIKRLSGKSIGEICSGSGFIIARSSSGVLYGWGSNGNGELGLDAVNIVHTPRKIKFENVSIKQISTGYRHTLALTDGGEIYTWGWNKTGQIGNCTTADQRTPLKLKGNRKVASVSCGFDFSTLVTDDGKVYTWGRHSWVTENNVVLKPTQVLFPSNVKIQKIVCGHDHIMALSEDMRLFTWGVMNYGSRQSASHPILLEMPSPVMEIFSVWNSGICGIRNENKILLWQPVGNRVPHDLLETYFSDFDDLVAAFLIRGSSISLCDNQMSLTPLDIYTELLFCINVQLDKPDVSFKADGNVINAHKRILQERSHYFACKFDWRLLQLNTVGSAEIQVDDIFRGVRFEVFCAFLYFIYTGKVHERNKDILELYWMAYMVEPHLQNECARLLKNMNNSL